MNILRIALAVTVTVALLGGATAGVVVAHDPTNDDCQGLHTADGETDGTDGNETVNHNHDECHDDDRENPRSP